MGPATVVDVLMARCSGLTPLSCGVTFGARLQVHPPAREALGAHPWRRDCCPESLCLGDCVPASGPAGVECTLLPATAERLSDQPVLVFQLRRLKGARLHLHRRLLCWSRCLSFQPAVSPCIHAGHRLSPLHTQHKSQNCLTLSLPQKAQTRLPPGSSKKRENRTPSMSTAMIAPDATLDSK